MIRRAIALAAALCLAACGPRAPELPRPSPALWSVTGPHGELGWLFGTIHALPDGAKWTTAPLNDALKQAGVLVVEVANLGDLTTGQQAFAAVSSTPGLPPLLSRLPPDQRPALAAALKRTGLDEGNFASTESWAAALIISNAQDAGEGENGVDQALLKRGLPVIGLEGFAEQFAIFDHLPQRDQADLLYYSSVESAPDEDGQMTAAWVKGDLQTLSREANEGMLADPELRQALLVNRNRAWLARIVPLLQQKRRPFVAVGAAHMLGDVGLPAMLAAQGYTVRRIQ